MMKTLIRSITAVAACGALMLGATATSAAQNVIPGDNSVETPVVVDPSIATVTVTPAEASATAIEATFQNTSNFQYRCEDPTGTGAGGTATEADVALKTEAYYENFGIQPNPIIPIAVSSVSIPIDLTPILGILPGGSAAAAFGNNVAGRSDITEAQANAVQRGHSGTVTPFTLNPGQTINLTFPLGFPAAGPRTDFDAATIFVCKANNGDRNGQLFLVTGYEGGRPDGEPKGNLTLGSLGRR